MKYALLIYGSQDAGEPRGEIDPAIAAVLDAPSVIDWARLQGVGSATTVRRLQARQLLLDGPFVDSKEYLAGLVIVESSDLDGALGIAKELQELRPEVAVEVRPMLESA